MTPLIKECLFAFASQMASYSRHPGDVWRITWDEVVGMGDFIDLHVTFGNTKRTYFTGYVRDRMIPSFVNSDGVVITLTSEMIEMMDEYLKMSIL